MRNGMRHSGSVSTSFKLFNQKFTFNPAASFTERWYLQTISKSWDNVLQETVTDTVKGFARAGDMNFTASLTTKIYGYYKYKGKRQTTLRHVLTPSLNFSYHPDYSTQEYGFFGSNGTLSSYSPFDIGIYGKPPAGEAGLISLNLINNVEMKFRSSKDTVTGFKKISLIDNFAINGSYNIFADSMNFSLVSLSGRTTLLKSLGVVYSGTIDPYLYNNGVRSSALAWANGSFGSFTNNSLALTWNIKSKQKKNVQGRNNLDEEDREELERNSAQYVDFALPWSVNLGYTIRTDRIRSEGIDSMRILQAITANGDFSLTEKWKIGFNTGYDFVAKDFTYTEINIFRDLHCWEMRFNWVPFGFRRSYMIQINVKASMLQDLKLMRRRSWYDTF
jgi:hypothetical protein